MKQPVEFDVNVAGPLSPGTAIGLSVSVRSLVPNVEAVVSLAAPEIQAARSSGWINTYYIPANQRIKELASERVSLSQGGTARITETVSALSPGYFRIVATAKVLSATTEGEEVQDVVHKEIWLWISHEAGRVTETFEPSIFPDGVVTQPGPLRLARRDPGPTAAAAVQTSGTRSFEVLYWNQDASAYHPLRGATVTGTAQTPSGTSPINVFTDTQGRFTVPCEFGWENVYSLQVTAQNAVAIITPNTTVEPRRI